MTNKQQKEYYQAYKQKVMDSLDMSEDIFNMFRLNGLKLNKIYTDYCNGDITEKEEDKLEYPIYTKLKSVCQLLGYFIYYQTDPRGATIYLDTKPIPDNNYNSAYCIY
jgi:hypothetical protein